MSKAATHLPLPPKLKDTGLLGSAKEMAEDTLGFLEKRIPEMGPIFEVTSILFKFTPGFDRLFIVSDPEMVRHILQENNRNYVKSYAYRVLELLLGKGLLTSEGDFWRKQRRLIQPAFHRKRLANFVRIKTDAGHELVNRWSGFSNGTEIDVSVEMMKLTLDVVCKAMLSSDISDAMDVVNKEFDQANEMLIERVRNKLKLPIWIPTAANRAEKRTYATIKQVVANIIEKRRRSDEKYDDLLAMLMEAEDADTGEKMSDEQIQDEVITIFLAGHETTAVALSWLFYLLAEYPEVEEKLVEEAERVLQGRTPTMEDLRSLKYTRMVIDETLRLYTPAWVIGRHTLDEDQLGGYRVPKDTNCIMPVYYIHRDPKYWPDPLRFRPERFDKEESKGRHKFSYFPFSGGPRLCIGNNFALMEMQLVIPMIIRRFKLARIPGREVVKDPLITMRPKPNLQMRLTAR